MKHVVLRSKAVPARPYGEMLIIRAYPAVALRRKEWAYLGQFITRYAVPYVIGKQGGFGQTLEGFTRKIFSFISGGAIGVG
ncbi:phage portal protein family protein, partial [Streptomyces hilarionis]|uniref:phage portal protein family protein n=1 Tax=Streptomyces hilarionis TaxID=2839954 RepID=UPI003F687B09